MAAQSQVQQPVSGLGALKRSWSGNAYDLCDSDDDAKVLPVKQRKLPLQQQQPYSSSPRDVVDDWQATPDDEQAAMRQAMLRARDDNVLKSKVSGSAEMFEEIAGNNRNGVRVSGLSRGLSRTSSNDAPFANGYSSSGSASSAQSSTKTRPIPWSNDQLPSIGESSKMASSSSRPFARHDSATFQPKTKEQLSNDRKRAGQGPSFLTAPVKAKRPSERASSANPSDEYKEVEQTVPGMFRLSAEQLYVRDLVVEKGKNVFFTGSAGTGKSVLLRDIIKLLKAKHAKRPEAVAITASTGIAACNISGTTLHSFAGVGLGGEPFEVLLGRIKRNRKAMGRWSRTQVLIIDEISMVDPDLLDKLEQLARNLRKSPKPFGGIQVIITGDFFQLPPVMKTATKFAFEAEMWDKTLEHKVNLTQVFRQKDQTFVRMLNEMRFGKLSADTVQRFKQLSRVPDFDENIVPTQLFPHRADVDKANNSRLMELKVTGHSYNAKDTGTLPPDQLQKTLSGIMAPEKIFLKIGAQVMMIKNLDESLVNGSIGTVVAFLSTSEYKFSLAKYSNLTEDANLADLQAAQKENRLREASPVKAAMASDSARSTPEPQGGGPNLKKGSITGTNATMKWPLVRFTQPGGGHRTELILPETWKNELPNGEVQASRTQIPLILAWAMSIHKSQGQTIPCCKIDLGKVFEKGQAYVALSRATCLEGLQVLDFRPERVMAHSRVIEWSKSLAAVTPKLGG